MLTLWRRMDRVGYLIREIGLLRSALEPLLARTPTAPVSGHLLETTRLTLDRTRHVLSREPGVGNLRLPRLPLLPTATDVALLLTLAQARLVRFKLRIEEIFDQDAEEEAAEAD